MMIRSHGQIRTCGHLTLQDLTDRCATSRSRSTLLFPQQPRNTRTALTPETKFQGTVLVAKRTYKVDSHRAVGTQASSLKLVLVHKYRCVTQAPMATGCSMAGSLTVVSTSQQLAIGMCDTAHCYSTYEFRSDKENLDPSEGQKQANRPPGAAGKGLSFRPDARAGRQAPLQDITAVHKHVSLSKEKLKALRMVR